MNNSGLIDTSENPDLITSTVLAGGLELAATYEVVSLAVSLEINRIPYAQIVLVDGEASEQDFAMSNESKFAPGESIEIKAGYHNNEETIFKGIIIKHNIKIREGSSHLILECKDEAVKMTIGRKSHLFYESKDSSVFEEIIDTYGLEKEVEATKHEHAELVQYQATDWDFMLSRAQASGKLCWVDGGKITIAAPDLGQGEVETITYGSSMLDFDGEIDARYQKSKITGYGWNYADQEVVEVEGTDPNVELNGNITPSELANVVGLENLELKHGGNLTEVQLQDWTDATFLYNQLAKVRGRVKFQGIPGVKPATMLKLEGVGDRFNGKVFVTGVRHTITDGNWTSDAQFGLDPEWFSECYEIDSPPAGGLLPAIKGLQIGVVTQLEEDPDGEDRILVKVPIVDGEEQGIWARVASLDAGDSRGAFFRPEIDDEVIIGFINEDPNHCVVLGMLHSSAKPAPITASDDNHEKGFFTRSEMKLLFDDDKKSVTIETPGGKIFTLDEDAGEIRIEDDNSNIVTMDSNGIVIESAGDIDIKASGDVNIEGMNVNVTAQAEFVAEGSAGAEVSSSAIAVLKGSLVQIN